jgi:uroporphyrinogen-III synthase
VTLSRHTILLTRPEGRDAELAALLKGRGAEVIHAPAIRFESTPANVRPEGFDWLAVTSPTAAERLPDLVLRAAISGTLRTASLGEGTRRALAQVGIGADLVAGVNTGVGLARAMLEAGIEEGARVLHPTSDRATTGFREMLEHEGVEVAEVVTYRTCPAGPPPEAVVSALTTGGIQVAVFASPSAVTALIRALPPDAAARLREDVLCAAIGPTTSGSLRASGVRTVIQAPAPTALAMVGAICGAVRLPG